MDGAKIARAIELAAQLGAKRGILEAFKARGDLHQHERDRHQQYWDPRFQIEHASELEDEIDNLRKELNGLLEEIAVALSPSASS